jgi:hypothetical protein
MHGSRRTRIAKLAQAEHTGLACFQAANPGPFENGDFGKNFPTLIKENP